MPQRPGAAHPRRRTPHRSSITSKPSTTHTAGIARSRTALRAPVRKTNVPPKQSTTILHPLTISPVRIFEDRSRVGTAPALKGRDKVVPPFQGWGVLLRGFPGRCPGLACLRTFGAPSRRMPKVHNRLSGQRRGFGLVLRVGALHFHAMPAHPPQQQHDLSAAT